MTETQTKRPIETLDKTVRVGTRPGVGNVYCRIRFADGRLSISGVEGPKANGDCRGGAGQIVMGYAHRDPADNDRRYADSVPADAFTFASGWDADTWLRFVDVWETWHLNDMRAACEHQRGWDTGREILLYHWRLDDETHKAQRAAKRDADAQLLEHGAVTVSDETRALLNLPWAVVTVTADTPEHYTKPTEGLGVQHVERKTAGWVKPSEHPDGLLTKPCDVCGYKYGTKWLHEDVPADVLDFLAALPDTDRTPAWV